MHRLEEQIRKELSSIEDKGLTQSNLGVASELVDLLKDIAEIREKGGDQGMYGRYPDMGYRDSYRERNYRDGGYNDGYMYRDGGYDRRGYNNTRMREHMERMRDGMERYEYGRDRYQHGGGEEHRIYEGLEQLMQSVCMFVEAAMEFAETPHEKEIIRKHAQKIGRV